jgi:transcriptional regulator with XRE-family HTH domain
MKTISDRIFEKLKEKGMSQKEFSQKTGIAESSISDWKKKHTNPVSDKI